MQRRSFLASPLALSFVPQRMAAAAARNDVVVAYGDGIPHTPEQYAQLLAKLTAGGTITPDSYSRGGVVEQLESRMAEALSKKRPSGCRPARSPTTLRYGCSPETSAECWSRPTATCITIAATAPKP